MSIFGIDRNILLFLKQINYLKPPQMDALIVTAFLEYNNLISVNNIVPKLNDIESKLKNLFIAKWHQYQQSFNLEDLIELFEFVVSPAEKEVNGAVYTPLYIREYIVDEVFKTIDTNEISHVVIGDLSCGCGGFLMTVAQKLHHQYGLTYKWIYQHNIVGVDIASYSVNRTQIILKLLALLDHEFVDIKMNIYCQNSLIYDFRDIKIVREREGFDVIVGNPPYVSSSKMTNVTKSLVARFETARCGKADLYIPFFQLSIEALRHNGILGFITANNFYRSVNGRALRRWFADNGYYIKLIDFGGEQIFKCRSTYTCLCFVYNTPRGYIDYVKSSKENLSQIYDKDYVSIEYEHLNHAKGWLLASNQVSDFVSHVERIGKSLGECYPIVNGFATLNNKIYIFRPIREDKNTYTIDCKYGNFQVEKSLCKDAIKPNILQTEIDVMSNMEKVIFPYRMKENKMSLISEEEIMRDYPLTYQYLSVHKTELAKRDKGQREYAAWYGYGRSQALNIPGYKLLFPYIAERPRFILTERKDLLFYNGYAICSDNIDDLILLKKILSTKLFWDYICATSKPYNNGYYALAKNYIKYFGIPNLSKEQKKHILLETDVNRLEAYLQKIYFTK